MLNGSANRAAAPCGFGGQLGGNPTPKGGGAYPPPACALANFAPFAAAAAFEPPFLIPPVIVALLERFDDERFPFSSSRSTSAASVAKSNNASATSCSLSRPRLDLLDVARGFARDAGFETYSFASHDTKTRAVSTHGEHTHAIQNETTNAAVERKNLCVRFFPPRRSVRTSASSSIPHQPRRRRVRACDACINHNARECRKTHFQTRVSTRAPPYGA